MNETQYRQCKLAKHGITQTAWIPAMFAASGRILRLREDGVWDDGWRVVEVWQSLPESQLPDSHKERKAHKIATGDIEL